GSCVPSPIKKACEKMTLIAATSRKASKLLCRSTDRPLPAREQRRARGRGCQCRIRAGIARSGSVGVEVSDHAFAPPILPLDPAGVMALVAAARGIALR